MTRKQQLYLMLLKNGLVFIRNYQSNSTNSRWWNTQFWKRRKSDRSCYEVAQFLHNLPGRVAESEFTQADIWFLNHPTRQFFQRPASKTLCSDPNFLSPTRQIFQLVPETLRDSLEWDGPELPKMPSSWQAELNEHLFWAVEKNDNIETLHSALAQGADITARNGNGKTALGIAIELGKTQHVQVLKEAGAQE